jgi:hypothetical protein
MKKNLGNPLMVAALAPAIQQNAPIIIKTATSLVTKLVLGMGVGLGVYKGLQYLKRKKQEKLIQQSAYDINIRAAVNVYDAIPDGLKEGKGSVFNPLGFITDFWNKIALVWTNANTNAIYSQAVHITDWDKCAKTFRTLYGENMLDILKKALTDAQYTAFLNEAARPKLIAGSAETGSRAYAKVASYGYKLVVKISPPSISLVQLTNGIPAKADLGIATGNEQKSTTDGKMYAVFNVNGIGICIAKENVQYLTQAGYNSIQGQLNKNWI